MRKLLWVALLMGTILLMGAIVPAQEKRPQFTFPGMLGMGSMMGMGIMGISSSTLQEGNR